MLGRPAEGCVEIRDDLARFRWVWWLLGLSEKMRRGMLAQLGHGVAGFVRDDDEGAACSTWMDMREKGVEIQKGHLILAY
ncbi:unnamed protein product [Dovyalis caffra]|uniref:Uncharacterized protein n=1 Tax=Dovyalis caffra TaxID=77055 RepID=A0AAV1SRM4_9ROSI|nr:unnamed protein product [Dovyalis caffra]